MPRTSHAVLIRFPSPGQPPRFRSGRVLGFVAMPSKSDSWQDLGVGMTVDRLLVVSSLGDMSERILTRGAQALARVLAERGAKQKLSVTLCCSDGLVSRWVQGERVPTVRYAVQIEDALGIPARWWSEPASLSPDASASLPAVTVDDDDHATTERQMPAVPPSPSSEPPPRTAAA